MIFAISVCCGLLVWEDVVPGNRIGLQKLTGSTCLTFSPLEKGLTASARLCWCSPEKVPSWCQMTWITCQPQPSNVPYIQSVHKRTQPRTLTVIAWTLTFTFSPSALFYTVTNIFTFTSSLLLLSLLSWSTETRKLAYLYHLIISHSQPFWNGIILLQHDNKSLTLQLLKKHAQYGTHLIKGEVRHTMLPTQMRDFIFNTVHIFMFYK